MTKREVKEWKFYTDVEKREKYIPSLTHYEECLEEWVAFWRKNRHRFIQDYFWLRLRDFQEDTIYNFDTHNTSVFVASRGIGKSFLTAAYACSEAVLYPGAKIVVLCSNKSQAKNLITEKIEKELRKWCPMLDKEIEDIKRENEIYTVMFKNGSSIAATNLSENRRGMRATVLIIDEAVWVDKNELDSIAKPFLNYVHNPPYKNNQEYATYPARPNKTIFLTSAYYKSNWFYEDAYLTHIRKMLTGKSSYVCNFNIDKAVEEGLLLPEGREELRDELDDITYSMEAEGIFYGENANAFFKADEIERCRILENTFIPPTTVEWLTHHEKEKINYRRRPPWRMPKEEDEIRIISADIALQAGKENDNSVYTLMRLIPNKNGKIEKSWLKEVSYIEAHNGMKAMDQATRIKQLFYDFECDRAIIDAFGIGIAVYNELCKITHDKDRGIEYPAWGAYNIDGQIPTTVISDKHYVLYAMRATSESNHKMALTVKDELASKRVFLPIDERQAKKNMQTTHDFGTLGGEKKARLLRGFAETTLLFMEMIELEYSINQGRIMIKEKRSGRKDRYSSFGYGIYLLNEIIDEMKGYETGYEYIFLT